MKHYRVHLTEVEYRIDGNMVSSKLNKDLPWSNWVEVDRESVDWLIRDGILVEIKEYDCPNDN